MKGSAKNIPGSLDTSLSSDKPYALATVVRTQGLTSAKAGSKATITQNGEIIGWVGGGCVRGAIKRVAVEVLKTGEPRLIRVKPSEEVASSKDTDGVELHKSGCPSKGTTDVFIEPVLPKPELVIVGASPVAVALAEFGTLAGFRIVRVVRNAGELGQVETGMIIEGFDLGGLDDGNERFIVIATQGAGDIDALSATKEVDASYISFVASRSKFDALRQKLLSGGYPVTSIDRIKAPAGLNIGARGPEELALSILAEIIELRRANDGTSLESDRKAE